jgi:hypothetical protein
VTACGLANELGRSGYFKIEETQSAPRMQAVVEMLDVDSRILRMHQSGHRIFAPIDDDGRVHCEEVFSAGVVDMPVGMQDVAHVGKPEPVLRKLILIMLS